ncbi:phosphocarrier protein HPr /phosphoenolpyruvate--protein phosphotransferase /PTS system IIA component (Glc family) [Vogesella indigofera]|uniref:phosphoenolpyruvate--protein phosphotransferase n=1 Tax=Vogesella indigofera TaxID=45465 RepID=A0A495AX39_VOGIN|nr:phosphoenolpyruvate--protein phosphotransferase [Vogesella indigofera]RKQ53292.1 phosphocarrier protein HPr /phosphoenolpyruvate--protein phosphotransferase /PTS system IIA component (Glc family) [Vogesella indigofera]
MSATITLAAPLSGLALPLSAVPDPVFAGGMMGAGLAIEPLSTTLLAPCAGDIIQLSATGHALTLRAANGAEVLLHIGIDTVKLGGAGFTPLVATGAQVVCGQPLIEFDIDAIARRAPSLLTVIVVSNSDAMTLSDCASGPVQAGAAGLLTIRANGVDQASAPAAAPACSDSARVAHEGGLHARPSALLQGVARRFDAQLDIEFNGQRANARSVTALMTLGVGEGDRVTVHAGGAQAAEALAAMLAALQTATAAGHVPVAAAVTAPAARSDGKLGGVCAAPGMAVGTVVLLAQQERVLDERGHGIEQELAALTRALAQVQQAVAEDVAQAEARGAHAESEIFGAHLALLDDPQLQQAAEGFVRDGCSAAFAYRRAIRQQSEVLLALGNALLAERVADLKDLERRVISALLGEVPELAELPPQAVVVADDLTPSQLTRLPRERLAALVLARGGASNHVAILCRALAIPSLVAAGDAVLALAAGSTVWLDAGDGWLDPALTAANLAAAHQQIAGREARRDSLRRHAAAPAHTLDGVAIEVAANIVNAAEAAAAVRHGADGVGLLRTEFLFAHRSDAPDEAEQRAACQAVLDALDGRTAIIRTLDAGGDKEVPYLPLPPEDNPALGLRGIRTGLAMPAVLDSQLRALLSLTPLSRLRILLPMITDLSELQQVRTRIDELAREMGLSERPQLGVMIEVPSAALLAEQLAAHADFLSIGTNDLTQYTLAMDRCSPALAARLDPLHPAVLRLIEMTVRGARQHGRWVGVCGAMASDLAAVPVLLGLGVTELSVSPALVPEVKACVRQLQLAQCREQAQALLQQSSPQAVRALLQLADTGQH